MKKKRASVRRGLDLLKLISKELRPHPEWSDVRKEIEAIVATLERGLEAEEAEESRTRRLAKAAREAAWWISVFFNMAKSLDD